jgi:M6 family metalloprotease-like protein
MHPISLSLKNTCLFVFTLLISIPSFSANKYIRGEAASFHTLTDPLNASKAYLSGIARSTEPDTIRIMALRVQFAPDSLKTTTGNGHFDLSTESDYLIDPPPHDKMYFEHQLLALKNYFSAASNGRLVVEYQVFPPQNDDAYQTSNDMIYYSGEEDEEKQKARWAELLQDGIAAAESQDNPDFSVFDTFIIYHAGVGKDFAFDFTETPFDIQSAFIDLATLQETIGENSPAYEGIPAGQDFFIQNGIILPEQQSQKEINLGLLGTATLLFGSHIGMPSLFQTDTGRAGIGMWGLMDQGSYNYFGLIPALPSAWEKVYMGWEDVVTVTSLDDAILGSSTTTSAPHLFKIPITSSEYYLIENRQEDLDGDRITYGRDESGVRVKFDSLSNIVAEQGLGVITQIEEYDYGLPGSGLLIWHIDDNVIRQNLEGNTINNDPEHRGVDLVECDGPQDMGQQYSMFTPGYGTDAGDYWDAYWSGNISHKYINGEKPVEFSSTSIPPSIGHNRSATHIQIFNISDKDTLMTFSIGNDWHVPGFPQYTGEDFGKGALTNMTLDDGTPGIIAVAKSGRIYGWRANGDKIIDNDQFAETTDVRGNNISRPLALLADVENSVSLPPAIVDYLNDSSDDILIIDEEGGLTIWSTKDQDDNGRADLLKSISFDEKLTSIPNGLNGAGTENGNFIDFQFDNDGNLTGGTSRKIADAPLIARHLYQGARTLEVFLTNSGQVFAYNIDDGSLAWNAQANGAGDAFYSVSAHKNSVLGDDAPLVVTTSDGYITLIDADGVILNDNRRYVDSAVTSAPSIGDVDGDGEPELILVGESWLYSFELMTGALTLNFPQPIENNATNASFAAPLWFEAAEQASANHTIVATSNGHVHSFDELGRPNEGFPLSLGAGISGSPMLVRSGESANDEFLFAASSDGFLYAWNLNQSSKSRWPRFGGGLLNSFYYEAEAVVVASSDDVMPKKKVFCYPNPAENGRTFIRYTLNDLVDQVSIRIFDIAGSPVIQMDNGGISRGDHEVIWDVTTIQSGAYFARVEAQTTKGNAVEFIKIAVVK